MRSCKPTVVRCRSMPLRDCRREPDAVFRVADVVVHRFRHGDYLHGSTIEFRGVARCVVTANRYQVVEAERLDVFQYRRSHIEHGAGDILLGRFFGFELLPLESGKAPSSS